VVKLLGSRSRSASDGKDSSAPTWRVAHCYAPFPGRPTGSAPSLFLARGVKAVPMTTPSPTWQRGGLRVIYNREDRRRASPRRNCAQWGAIRVCGQAKFDQGFQLGRGMFDCIDAVQEKPSGNLKRRTGTFVGLGKHVAPTFPFLRQSPSSGPAAVKRALTILTASLGARSQSPRCLATGVSASLHIDANSWRLRNDTDSRTTVAHNCADPPFEQRPERLRPCDCHGTLRGVQNSTIRPHK